ncbi:hypothetical protein K469DRAFT_754364 [Zopfia rhizophila CBS 207.26]|uniref:HCNGP-domain-containing protein n=1 Tax=Zopfia rhizophila CBS 207.26 TaxID=1314779 RepID=A0A6A6DG98_9PEZI|nr:hypothetical protein K469DRAFT_754364 [Zopfia rhizophila CBS 207.26]
MLGINYESSDDEEVAAPTKTQANISNEKTPAKPSDATTLDVGPTAKSALESSNRHHEEPPTSTGPAIGPALGPSVTSPPPVSLPTDDVATPQSPYTSTRSAIQNLTLPTVPNFDIPPSPPGSPPPSSTKKFAQFLELKKKGVHFNQRLESSTALRNPSHLQKLMDFAGIRAEEQYTSTLPKDIAVPAVFPEWAYVEQLTASQKQITKAREEHQARVQREAIEFVPATGSGVSSKTGTPSARGPRSSAAERVMAGLGREKSGSPYSQDRSKRKELEHRGGRNDHSRSRWRSRSRSPKRKRSRSRDRR